MSFHYFFTNSWSCSIILNRTRNILPAPAPDCLCPAGLPSWSVTFLLNRTSPNILPLCKVMFPGSLHPNVRQLTAAPAEQGRKVVRVTYLSWKLSELKKL